MLSYEDIGGAADWLVRAFGFEELERFEHEGEVMHVSLPPPDRRGDDREARWMVAQA